MFKNTNSNNIQLIKMKIIKSRTLFPFLCAFLLLFAFTSCGTSSPQAKYEYIEEGLDKIVKENLNEQSYTVILADMNYEGEGEKYLHKYQVIKAGEDSLLTETTTDWMEVSPVFFQSHENDLGMELASKTDGVLKKEVAPPGYSNYVGNEQYGEWRTGSNGSSFWHFYGQYAFMSMMFRSMGPSRSSWNGYNTTGRNSGKPYYGKTGSEFGTKKAMATGGATKSTWASKPSAFRDKVRTQVSQSATAQKAGKSVKTGSGSRASSSSKAPGASKTSRSSSRYNSGGSSRSRSGGFGK